MLNVFTAEKVNSKLDEIHRANENQPVCQCDGECVPAAVAVVNKLRDFRSVSVSLRLFLSISISPTFIVSHFPGDLNQLVPP